MARRNAQTLKGRISSATGSYMGNNGQRSLTGGNGRMVSRRQKYGQVRAALGLTSG